MSKFKTSARLIKIRNFFFNRFVLVSMVLLGWLCLFDKNDFVRQYKDQQKLNSLQRELKYYENEATASRERMNELFSNTQNLEKFAREKYLFKKDNEEIFVIVRDQENIKPIED